MEDVTWEDISVGDGVLGRDGHTWIVQAANAGAFTLEREGKKPFVHRPEPATPVQRTFSVQAELDAATALVEAELGGRTVHLQADDEPPMCPPDFDHPGVLIAHLHMLHGVRWDGTVPEATLGELISMHKTAHDNKNEGYRHHWHTPDYAKVNAVAPDQD